ncbi:MAG: AMP-binding protein [Proteobacteria bacterium]|nr:AMP-binding protein [Pseudomonadota bacterium]
MPATARTRRALATGGRQVDGNIAQYLASLAASEPGRIVYREFEAGTWTPYHAIDVAARAARWQAAFRREGLAQGDRVAICLRNGVDWVAVDLAALGMGLVVVPLYVDDNTENIGWCAANAGARLCVAENARLAMALTGSVAGDSPRQVVVLADDAPAGAVSARHFLHEETTEFECRTLPPATLATICYTSGTTGRPKGVMLSHGNILANVEQCRATGMALRDDRFLSILPLSHMFERTGGYYLPLAIGACVSHGRGVTQIGEDLMAERPTKMFAVPRVFEKSFQRIDAALGSGAKRWLFDACVARGYRVAMGNATALDRMLVPALRHLVARPILARLGGRMRFAVVGGAALDPALARAFIGLGLPLLQGYGMTEASPVVAVNRADDNRPESVGTPLDGVDVRLGDGGELQVRGANVMQGYWHNEEATRAAFTDDGWLRTGDVARMEGRHIVICGRVKDIVVMSNGEKLSPGDAEMAIQHDPAFDQTMVVGEGRPYPILLAVTNTGDSEDALLKRANAQLKTFPRWVRMRRVVVMREPWSVENGLMTPTLKVKRAAVAAKYKDAIEQAYRSE